MPQVRECVSAGGLLLRKVSPDIFVVIVERMTDIESKWKPVLRQLPKGNIEVGESPLQAALREVKEETGFDAEVLAQAGTAEWSYDRNGERFHETIHYYFLRPASVAPAPHDTEFETVRWVSIQEARRILSYPEERQLIERVIASGLSEVVKSM
jgi:8-oxo-dGTP diphosphatase